MPSPHLRSLRPIALALAVAFGVALLPYSVQADPVSPNGPISTEWVAKWRADLAFAADSLPRVHPNFYRFLSKEAYRGALDSLSARLPRLSQHEIVVGLAKVIVRVGDGHTRVTFPFDPGAGFHTGHSPTDAPKIPGLVFRHYPIRLGLFADTLFVIQADAAHRVLLGGRVVSLGRRTASEARAAVWPAIHRDNESGGRNLLPSWLVCPEILHACGVVTDMEQAPIVVEQPSGGLVTGQLTPVPPGAKVEWLAARDTSETPLRDQHPNRRHWFTTIPRTRTIYARYREVYDDENETIAQFAESLFSAIRNTGADRLIFDVRDNDGGNGTLNRPLVQHLIRTDRLWQPGGLWALIDRGTFSAAVMMASDLERWTPAVFVGEATGGDPNSPGDSRKTVLPNSGITVRVSSLYWQLTGPQDRRDSITPHIPVDMRYADWRANKDPALETALANSGRGRASDFAGSWSGILGWQFARYPLGLDLEATSEAIAGQVDFGDLENSPIQGAEVARNELVFSFGSQSPWVFRGRRFRGRMIGLVRYKGVDYPVVLERSVSTARPASTP